MGCGPVKKMVWTTDGQMLTVCTSAGLLLGFLMVIPNLFASYKNRIAFLTSLSDVSIIDCNQGTSDSDIVKITTVNLDNEPNQMALSKNHLAVVMNTNA